MAYVRHVDNGQFIADMLFCEALETTSITINIYKKLKTYLDDKHTNGEHYILSCRRCSSDDWQEKWSFKIIEIGQSPNVVSALCYSYTEFSFQKSFRCSNRDIECS